MDCQKHLFQLDPQVHYLNCAYMAPMLKSVEELGIEGIRKKRDPFKITADDFFRDSESVRKEFASLIGSNESQRVALIPGTSYGMAIVANNISLEPGEEVIVMEGQFPSNFYIWDRLAKQFGAKVITLSEPSEFPRGEAWNAAILGSINDRTRVVAMPHVHWADGTRFDLISIRKKCNEHNTLLIIDGTQSVGALPFYVDEIRPDALICSGYKWLMGPYSMGMAWFGDKLIDGKPLEENWINRKNSENFKELVNYQAEYQPGALRYDVGERSNFILLPMMLEALRQINEWGVENIYDYCSKLSGTAITELREMGYELETGTYLSHHLFGVRRRGFDPVLFSEKLNDAKIYVSVRGNAVRVAVNVFNDQRDMEALLEVCRSI